MSEIFVRRLKECLDKNVKVFLKNGFKFEGKVTGVDEQWLELLEFNKGYKLLKVDEIVDLDAPRKEGL